MKSQKGKQLERGVTALETIPEKPFWKWIQKGFSLNGNDAGKELFTSKNFPDCGKNFRISKKYFNPTFVSILKQTYENIKNKCLKFLTHLLHYL